MLLKYFTSFYLQFKRNVTKIVLNQNDYIILTFLNDTPNKTLNTCDAEIEGENQFCNLFVQNENFRNRVFDLIDKKFESEDQKYFFSKELFKRMQNKLIIKVLNLKRLLRHNPDDLYLKTILVFTIEELCNLKYYRNSPSGCDLSKCFKSYSEYMSIYGKSDNNNIYFQTVSIDNMLKYYNYKIIGSTIAFKTDQPPYFDQELFTKISDSKLSFREIVKEKRYDHIIVLKCYNKFLQKDVYFLVPPINFSIHQKKFESRKGSSINSRKLCFISMHLALIWEENLSFDSFISKTTQLLQSFDRTESSIPLYSYWRAKVCIRYHLRYYILNKLGKLSICTDLDSI